MDSMSNAEREDKLRIAEVEPLHLLTVDEMGFLRMASGWRKPVPKC